MDPSERRPGAPKARSDPNELMENELMINGRKQSSGASFLCNQPAHLIASSIFCRDHVFHFHWHLTHRIV